MQKCNIKKARGRIKQSELAEMLNVDVSTVSRWENGKNIPSGKVLQNIASALNTTVAYLSGETENPERVFVSDTKTGEKLLGLAEKYGNPEMDLTFPITTGIADDAYVINIGGIQYRIPKDEDGRKLFLSILQQNLNSVGIKVLIPGMQEKDNDVSQHININQHDIGRDANVEFNHTPSAATA